MASLLDTVIELHLARNASASARDRSLALRPDHLLLGPDEARFVLPLAAALLRGRTDLAAFGASDRPTRPPAAGDDEARRLVESGLRLGVTLFGASAEVEPRYREAAAAPGRLLAACGFGDLTVGGLGCLAWRVRPLEAAALLCGAPVGYRLPAIRRVVLTGRLAPGVRGTDAALELTRRLDPRRWVGCGVECSGDGAASLEVADRLAFAHLLTSAGAEHVLFPSDERTREALRAWDRDSDWRELHAAEEPAGGTIELELDLATLEPLVAPWSDVTQARPLRQLLGRALRGVVVGSHADETEAVAFADWVGDAAPAIAVLVHAGGAPGRAAPEPPEAPPEPAAPPERATREDGGSWLGVGLGVKERAELGARAWVANVEVCAASALAGTLSDPRERADRARPEARPRSSGRRRMPSPSHVTFGEGEPGAPAAPVPLVPAGASLRAVVWVEVDDDCDAEHVLPRGARARRGFDDDPSAHLFPGRGHARAEDSGPAGPRAIVGGRRFGGGAAADEAAWALSRSGVRVVIARSIAPDAVRALARAGVLPLEAVSEPVACRGEEIEIPSLAEGVEAGHPVGVRNLTRGIQGALLHAMDAELVTIWRAGGILAGARARSAA